MTFEQYVPLAMRTANPDTPLISAHNYILGLFGEGGELTDVVKKVIYHGHSLDQALKSDPDTTLREKIKIEGGDSFWYIAVCAHQVGGVKAVSDYLKDDTCFDIDPEMSCIAYVRNLSEFAACVQHLPGVSSGFLAAMAVCVEQILKWAGVPLEEALSYNIEKLRKRYPLKFSSEDSLNRVV